MSDQFELFADAPFSMRLPIEEALRLFCEFYWSKLPIGKKSKAARGRIAEFFKGRYIDSISKHDVGEFRRHLNGQGLGGSTGNKHMTMLKRTFSKLADFKEAGVINGVDFRPMLIPAKDKNPCAKAPMVNERQFARKVVVTPEEFRLLIRHADPDLRDILRMLVWTRLRQCDLRRLTEKNINWHTRQLDGVQHKTITTRNPSGIPYHVPINQDVELIIRKRMAAVAPGAPLFPWSDESIKWRWKDVRKASGLILVQMRDLRRSGATFLLDDGDDEVTVSQGLGHTSTDTTRAYVPRTRRHLAASVEKLTDAFR